MEVVALDALDTLFFRDGKPFSMGEETWANGLFPPPLSVVYGALRTAYFSEHIGELKLANEGGDPTSSLRITFSALYGGGRYYYPCPLDVVQKKSKTDKKEYSLLNLVERQVGCCSGRYGVDLPMQLQSQELVEEASGLIDEISFNEYLQSSTVPRYPLNIEKFVKEEPKVGIGRNNRTGAADEGMLYRVGMTRMHQLKLVVGYSGLTISGSLMRLGGEGKSVSKERTEKPDVQEPKPSPKTGDFFKLYLATPAIFKEGWRPAPETVPGARLVAAVVGKPLHIGGFDMKIKKPKPMQRAVPAGSVYYYQGESEELRRLHHYSISDYGEKQGYGLYYIGNVNKDM